MTPDFRLLLKYALATAIMFVLSLAWYSPAFALSTASYISGWTDSTGGRAATPWNHSVTLPQFDPSLGTLYVVTIYIDGNLTGNVTATNNSSAAIPSLTIATASNLVANIPGTTDGVPVPIVLVGTSGTYTNVLVGAKKSKTTATAVHTLYNTASNENNTNDVINNFSYYLGSGNVEIPFDATSTWSVVGAVAGLDITSTANAGVSVTIQYDYQAVPEPSTYILLGISLGCVAFVRYRMTQGQATQTT
jgi:hypothetical protein